MYPIPANATRIEYLESTGTQYIDMGADVPMSGFVSFDVTITSSPAGAGIWGQQVTGTRVLVYFRSMSVGFMDAGTYGTINFSTMPSVSVVDQQYGGLEFDIVPRHLFTTTTSTGNPRTTRARAQLRSFSLKDANGVLVRSFVPVRVGSIGCLFDRVTGQFFYNHGTGNFVCGEDDFSIFSHAVKHLSGTGTFLASRAMGDSSGTVKAVRKHYDMPMQYTIDECNGNAPTAVNVYFPSGTYEDLDYTPTWSGHRFVGWYTTSSTPSTTAPTSGTQVHKGDSVVFDRSTVYARWQLPTTVTFDATTNGGQMPSGWTSPDYYVGQPYGTLPQPTKSGEVFLGWFTSGGTRVTAASTVTTGTLTARYAAVTYATKWEVNCTSTSYLKTGICSARSRNSENPTVVDWGERHRRGWNLTRWTASRHSSAAPRLYERRAA